MRICLFDWCSTGLNTIETIPSCRRKAEQGYARLSFQIREEVNQPLGFFRSASQRGILGVVGAGSHEGMQFAKPRQDGASVEEHISNCTLGGIRAVCVRGIGVAMQAWYFWNLAKVIAESKCKLPLR